MATKRGVAAVVAVWLDLPEAIQPGILAIVKAALPGVGRTIRCRENLLAIGTSLHTLHMTTAQRRIALGVQLPTGSDGAEEGFMTGAKSKFVAMSRFRIANGMAAAVHEAFRNRPHLADEAPGFIRMDVISTKGCPEEIRLITFWTDEESYRVWHRSHVYHESHAGIPKGLKLVPGSVAIEFFEHITS